MKISTLIPITIILGALALFFFPEPQTNFLAYIATGSFFVILTIYLIILERKNRS